MRKCLSNARACPRGRFGFTQRELPNKITPYICPVGGDLSVERSYLVLAFLTIFVSLVSIAAPVRAGEKGTFSTPWLSGVLSVSPVSGKEAPAVPGPLSLSDPGPAASGEAKAVVPVSPLVPHVH